ncbi:hypothetical protein J4413_01910 [Candidatus Woesearchaeota archaeon]|nr:hypothetical protein [Candidatus Woesearchaeota archaeon]
MTIRDVAYEIISASNGIEREPSVFFYRDVKRKWFAEIMSVEVDYVLFVPCRFVLGPFVDVPLARGGMPGMALRPDVHPSFRCSEEDLDYFEDSIRRRRLFLDRALSIPDTEIDRLESVGMRYAQAEATLLELSQSVGVYVR